MTILLDGLFGEKVTLFNHRVWSALVTALGLPGAFFVIAYDVFGSGQNLGNVSGEVLLKIAASGSGRCSHKRGTSSKRRSEIAPCRHYTVFNVVGQCVEKDMNRFPDLYSGNLLHKQVACRAS